MELVPRTRSRVKLSMLRKWLLRKVRRREFQWSPPWCHCRGRNSPRKILHIQIESRPSRLRPLWDFSILDATTSRLLPLPVHRLPAASIVTAESRACPLGLITLGMKRTGAPSDSRRSIFGHNAQLLMRSPDGYAFLLDRRNKSHLFAVFHTKEINKHQAEEYCMAGLSRGSPRR